MSHEKDSGSTDLGAAVERVLQRAREDPAFRELALKDPSAAITKLTGITPPSDVSLEFVDNSGPLKTIPLPAPVPGLVELDNEDLQAVAGGSTGWILSVSWRAATGS